MPSTWKDVKAAIKRIVPLHSYKMWIEPVECLSWDKSQLTLGCPNAFSRRRVQEHFSAQIAHEASRLSGMACRVALKVSIPRGNGREDIALSPDPQQPLPDGLGRFHSGRLLRRDFTFDQFVVGGSNDFAYSAALSLAAGKRSSQSALFLLSKTGMGKSHLSQAVGHHVLKESRSEHVYYVTAEDFTNEMVQAFRHDTVNDFKCKYRNGCDVLLLEDVHYLSGKERTQIELAYTLDNLYESGKKIIFSSCYLPSEIPRLSDELRSRLSCGLVSCIEPPEYRTRVRILKKKSKVNGSHVPEEVIRFLASELTDDVRQLESGLIGVTAKSSLLGAPVDLPLAESVVKTISRQRKAVTIESIKKLVAKTYGVAVGDMVSRSRKQRFVRPRQVAIFLSREYTDSPLQEIGRSFNRYHATVLHSIAAVEKGMEKNAVLKQQVALLRKKLDSGKMG
jgi:chromosomal replication initiator protein